jgi:hypothetical protein
MAEGISALGKTQIGIEASAGGSTDAPTTIWRGTGVGKDNLTIVHRTEKIGIYGGTADDVYIPATGGEVILGDSATYEQLGYIFQAGIKAVTPTTDASSGLTWTWAVQQGDSDPHATTDLGTLVIEVGDNVQAEIHRFGFVREFTLSGAAGETLALEATVETRAPATATYTTGLSIPTVEDILFSLGSLYIDDSTGTIGATVKSQTLLDMSLKMTTGWKSVKSKDNRKDFAFIKRISDMTMLDITFEHNGIAVVEKAAWRAKTERAIRLTFLGNALTTTDAGATYDTKALVIDMYGTWDTFGAAGLEEVDGNNVYKGTFRVAYARGAAADAKKLTFVIVNELATLP